MLPGPDEPERTDSHFTQSGPRAQGGGLGARGWELRLVNPLSSLVLVLVLVFVLVLVLAKSVRSIYHKDTKSTKDTKKMSASNRDNLPSSQFPVPSSQFPVPSSQFPVPSSQFPVPSSQFPVPKPRNSRACCPNPMGLHTGPRPGIPWLRMKMK